MRNRLNNPSNRSVSHFAFIDILRVVCALAVVTIHTVLPLESKLSVIPKEQWWFAVIVSSFSRFAVPVFIMISGYLLLEFRNNESWSTFYRKRLIRLCTPFFAFLTLYGWWSVGVKQEVTLSTYIIKTVVFGNPYGPLYFMYILLGLTVVTPFLRVLLRHLSQSQMASLIALLLGLASCWEMIISWFAHTWTFSYLFSVSWFIPYLGYYVLGYYLKKYSVRISQRLLGVAFFACGLLLAGLNGLFIERWGVNGQGMMMHNYINPLTIIMSASLFLYVLRQRWRTIHWIHIISTFSFGVYLLHQLLLDIVPLPSLQPYVVIAYVAVIFCLCNAIIFVISKLPYVRYIAGVQ